ncbi:hypothetical protein M0D69_34970 [Caballeronia sp. SEWSISQ10-4 2]|uniref:hypothetical protein n=1 Tax=Caballeronia sp. SEWSISQ10-4 2 TaxID=2937438 RepID=UPI00264F7FDD|nr:hypothetical protein [Caballeronia sp. SEWSISQ10-4 2]MDN7183126.1 hypothetical protein [Caballeronia sp. SEWSISQ10-4 2]
MFYTTVARIKALGIVRAPAATAPKPTVFGNAGAHWADDGWFVEVDYQELEKTIRPADHMDVLEALLTYGQVLGFFTRRPVPPRSNARTYDAHLIYGMISLNI